MRFAVKTAPEKTTWQDMLAVWQAADEIDLFESAWSFDHFDTISVCVSDAPRPDVIVVAIGIADGGRVNPRVGKGRVL